MQSIKLTPQEIEAIRNGNKTMFREPIKQNEFKEFTASEISEYEEVVIAKFSKYQVGETVFVQEEFIHSEIASVIAYRIEAEKHLRTDLTHEEVLEWQSISWQPASEMQEHQARLFLTITSIKAEALQDISIADAIKEGIGFGSDRVETHSELFGRTIWNEKNHEAPYDWEINPYVFANGFEVVEK